VRKIDRKRADALVADALRRAENGVREPEPMPKPLYRLPTSPRAGVETSPRATVHGVTGYRADGRGGPARRRRPRRDDLAFAFALALFALIVLVPSVAAVEKPGFAGIAAERLAGNEELAGYGRSLTRGAALIGN